MNQTLSAERYVAGRMTEEEAANFEEIMLSEPAVAADVDFRHRIKAGLGRLDEVGELSPMLAGAVPRRVFPYAAAASALFAAFAATWVLTRPAAVATNDRGASQTFTLTSLRSADVQLVAINAGTQKIVLRVPVDADQATYIAHIEPDVNGSMSVEPKSFAGTPGAVRDRTAVPASDGTVEILLDAGELQSGDYVLELTGTDNTSQTVPFVVSKAPPGAK